MAGLRARGRARRTKDQPRTPCPFCGRPTLYFHQCRYCDFHICQHCAADNDKIFSCNSVTWPCPDCGESNSL